MVLWKQLEENGMENLYDNKLIGYGYDFLASLIWFPSKNRLYNECVSISNIKKNDTVLEIGCGTGFLTQKIEKEGAIITAIDQSEGMLLRAKKSVPNVKFIQCDILKYKDDKRYNYIFLFFILHELNVTDRITLLKMAKNLLTKNGEIILCDYSIPEKGIMKIIFPKLIKLWEPQNTVDFLKNGLYSEIKNNNLTIYFEVKLHHGRVKLMKLKFDETK
jgi:ubiquinone/menaquinone biosynthesis C-methylase UbiE